MYSFRGYTLESIGRLTFVQYDLLVSEANEIMETKRKAAQGETG